MVTNILCLTPIFVDYGTKSVIFGVIILLIEKFGLGTSDLGLGTYGYIPSHPKKWQQIHLSQNQR